MKLKLDSKVWVLPLLTLLLLSCKERQEQAVVQPNYPLLTIAQTDCVLNQRYSAAVSGKQDIAIYPQVSGLITKLCVEEGEHVRAGQTLFVIDQVPYQAAVATAEASVKVAEAAVATAQLTYQSKHALFEKQVVSQYDLNTAENNYLSAQAQLAQAKAQLRSAENNLSYTVVTSPANGVVGTLPYRVGSLVSPSLPSPLTTVSDNSEMYVYFSMTENNLLDLIREYGSKDKALAAMPEVKLLLNDGSEYAHIGHIASISGVIDRSTGSASVRAVFKNPDGLLHSGASGIVVLPDQREGVILIPQAATYEIQDKVFVYRVVDGKATTTPVQVRRMEDGISYLVEEGLQVGDVIVREGAGLLREGTQVAATATAPSTNN